MGRLFWKFFFFIMVAQLTTTIGVGVLFSLENRARNQRENDLDLSPPAAFFIKSTSIALQYGGTTAVRKLLTNDRHHHVFIVDETGHDLMGREVSPRLIKEARSVLKEQPQLHVISEITADDGHTYLLFLPAPPNDRRPPRGEEPMDMIFPVMPIITSTVASLLFAMLLAWYFSHPIRQLKSAFANAASGNLDDRLAPRMGKRSDELADLGRDFDSMTDKLRALMDSQRRLLHDVSHELRSPIARMQASIGLARLQPEKIAATIERIEREGMRMDKLVGELLTLSRLEAGVVDTREECIRMDELLMEIINDAKFEAETTDRHVESQLDCQVIIRGGAELLHRAIENVVRNAVKQTATGTTVAINTRIDRDKQRLLISVIDHGPGIPEDELKHIFEPFFRSSRTQKNSNGYGLGLTIAHRIIEAHGGTITAFNRAQQGLCVDIILPYEMLTSEAHSDPAHPLDGI